MDDEPHQAGAAEPAEPAYEPVVDFAVLGRRFGRTAAVVFTLVAVGWLASLPFRGVDVQLLMNLVGLGLAAMFVAELVIVGGSAVRGLLRAGERGDRLSSEGVGLLPPQLTREGRLNRAGRRRRAG